MKKALFIAICCILPVIIVGFLLSRGNQKGSPTASQKVEPTGIDNVSANKTLPVFSVVDVDSRSISNDTLRGKPTIVWFTATWCTPCQIGAKKVAQLQNELGDDKLNVLVFFVDPKESADDLRNWRKQFANPTWKLAFNNGLAEKMGIRYLDSKYILDKNGLIKDFNTSIADDQYLALIRSVVSTSR